jgi:hypothetical protein
LNNIFILPTGKRFGGAHAIAEDEFLDEYGDEEYGDEEYGSQSQG